MRCVIISGSPDTNPNFIKKTVMQNDYVICADKGYFYAKQAEVVPNLLVGDFDSYTDSLPEACEILRLNTEKDDTDTEHCVRLALDKGFKEIVILGGLGGRLDHTLANIAVLNLIKNQDADACLLSENEEVMILKEGSHRLLNKKGKTFSLFPCGCSEARASVDGAKYPIKNGTIPYDLSLGVSNVFTDNNSVIEVLSGTLILIINNRI